MAKGSFERYPGPPPGRVDVFRVISPYRDALAWVSNAGKLTLVRFMVRDGDTWQTLVDDVPGEGAGTPLWEFVQRDPVELLFRASPHTGHDVTAAVTVSTEGCHVRVEPAVVRDIAATMIAPGTWMTIHPSRNGC